MTKNEQSVVKTREDLIRKYIEFFKSKNHKEIPNSSLIPSNDPTVLFTTAGMHPLVPYLLGQKHALGKRLCNVQACIRTGDIDSVGDNFHLTFFEMFGNWSLGDYFKKDAINYSFEFLTKILKIPATEISVTCFEGDKDAPKDEESAKIWQFLEIKKIKFLPKEENWWGPAGATGPCGPDTEMFVNGCEIWNDVFMQYVRDKKGDFLPAKQKNVDTGMGVERTLAIINNMKSVYETSTFQPIMKKIEQITGNKNLINNKSARIVADHIKAACFIISDGVQPSNIERGYVLRRLIRRAIRHGKLLGIEENFCAEISSSVYSIYPEYKLNKKIIEEQLDKEEKRFRKTLDTGLGKFKKLIENKKEILGKDAFLLFQSYGFPLEMTLELAKENKIKVDEEGFNKELKRHQKLSKTAATGKFKSGLADNSEITKKLHTASHLLNEALRSVLKDKNIKQKGSNINSERLRFDFNFARKLEQKEIKAVEDWINKYIKKALKVIKEEMPLSQALKSRAQAEFGAKYPEKVSVFTIGENISKEICTGPHVANTNELGVLKIIKEEAIAAGIRRIKAILE